MLKTNSGLINTTCSITVQMHLSSEPSLGNPLTVHFSTFQIKAHRMRNNTPTLYILELVSSGKSTKFSARYLIPS